MRAPLLWLMACTPPVELPPVAEVPTRTCVCEPDPACPPEVADVALAPVRDAEDALFAVRWVLDNLRATRAAATRSATEALADAERAFVPVVEFQRRLQLLDQLAPSPALTSVAFRLTPSEVDVSTVAGARAAIPRVDDAIASTLLQVRDAEAALALARDDAALAYPSCVLPAEIPSTPEEDVATWAAVAENTREGLELVAVARGVTEEVAEIVRRLRDLGQLSMREDLYDDRRALAQQHLYAWIDTADKISASATYGGISLADGIDTTLDIQVSPDRSLLVSLPDLQTSTLGIDSASISVDTAAAGVMTTLITRDVSKLVHRSARRLADATRALARFRDEAASHLADAAPPERDTCACEIELACPTGDAAAAAAPVNDAVARWQALDAGWGPLTEMLAAAVRSRTGLLDDAARQDSVSAYDAAIGRLAEIARTAPELDPGALHVGAGLAWGAGVEITQISQALDDVAFAAGAALVDVRIASAASAARWPRCPAVPVPTASGYTLEQSWSAIAGNVADAQEATRVALDAYDAVDERLLRIRRLAEDAVDATRTDRSRRRSQAEVDQLVAEIDALSETTWNGVSVAGAETTVFDVQVGIPDTDDDRVRLLFTDLSWEGLSWTSPPSVLTVPQAYAALSNVDDARDFLAYGRARQDAQGDVLEAFGRRAAGRGRQVGYFSW